jgi:hypothetical protein
VRLLRSFPAEIPAGRAYVVDGIERLLMADHDYTVLESIDDDVLLLEWDIAVGEQELRGFAARAATAPARVLAAPYRLYGSGSLQDASRTAVWSARRYPMIEAQPGDPTAHVVGFGMIYLPRELVRRYLADRDPLWGFSDVSFSRWHHRAVRPEILLDWSARPVHLHYAVPSIGDV